jgi:tryptophan synthase alpha chain
MTAARSQPRPGYRDPFANGKPVIPFLTAGFPNQRRFLETARAVADAGAGALEIGMPFSDPLADGPAIQHSSKVALQKGVTLNRIFDWVAALRSDLDIPIYLMGYLNPVLRMGMERFAAMAASAGVDGTILPDCPIEEAAEWIAVSRRRQLSNIFLIAPTSPVGRMRRIDRLSTNFSYCVSVAGVTGVRRGITPATKAYLRNVRSRVRKPFVVGFGIAKPEDIRTLKPLADGFVVGSALVSLIEDGGPAKVARRIAALVRATR